MKFKIQNRNRTGTNINKVLTSTWWHATTVLYFLNITWNGGLEKFESKFIWSPLHPSHELSCICVLEVMYLCVRGHVFVC